jgi:hypothetical protein
MGSGQGGGGDNPKRQQFILPAGFACCDPRENALETAKQPVSHTKPASQTLGPWRGSRRQAGSEVQPWKCVLLFAQP